MSEMIERVAEAMRLRAIERGHPIHPAMVHHLAAAAIEAMRGPTDDMLSAACEAGALDDDPEIIMIYDTMIGAALTPSLEKA